MDVLFGRKAIVKDLTALILKGQTVLFYGPMGIGKTAILEAVKMSIEKKHRPCGFAVQTRSLSSLTAALLCAYPDAYNDAATQLQIRRALRAAIANHPGVLLLDHIHNPGTQFKGFLHSLRDAGMGILITADAEVPRDHVRLRSMRLTWREMAVPPLSNRYMYRILADSLSWKFLPNPLKNSDRAALVKMSHGRPGWILMISDLLQKTDFWSNGNVLLTNIRISIMTEIARMYFKSIGDFSHVGK